MILPHRVLCLAASLLAAFTLSLHAQTPPAAATAPVAQPAPSAAPSLIPNSNLETDADGDGWPDTWPKLKAGGSWENEEGNHFIRMTSTTPGSMVMLYREIPVPSGVKAIELTWRQRVTNLKVGSKAWFDARIMMEFADASRAKVTPAPPVPNTRKNSPTWESKSVRFLVPPGATMLKFMPALFNVESGTYDLDDIALTPIDPASITAAAAEATAAKAKKLEEQTSARQSKAAASLTANGSLIPNGDFESAKKTGTSPDGWGTLKGNVSWQAEGDNHFVRLQATEPDKMVMLYRTIDIPAGTKALKLSWRWRVTDLKVGKMPWFDARMLINILDASGAKLTTPGPVSSRGTKDGAWVEKTTSFLVPEGGVSLVLMPSLFNVVRGTMDLDDLVLIPTDTAELEAAAKVRAEDAAARYVPPEQANTAKWPKELHVKGNRIVDTDGKEVWLQGVNAGGLETLPADTQVIKSTLVAIDDWKANAIRLPMNETFWFGRSPLQKDGGKAYRDIIDQCVMIAANRGAYLILDLHRYRAPKAEHAEFWKDAATHFKNHPAVLFDLMNEPHGISWKVWRDGGFVGEKKGVDESAFLTAEEKKKNQGFDSVGMQALADAVRSTGANNIVIAGGIGWSGDLSGVADGYELSDKTGNGIMYSWHQYNWHKGWDKTVLPVAAKYPVFVGEVGADPKKMDFIPAELQEDPYTWVPDMLGFIQKYRLNWTGWCFHPRATPVMISDWKYTPTPYWGVFAKEALAGKQFEMKKMR